MAILAADIQYRLSGGAGNSNPNASLGGAMSSTAAGDSLFDNVSSAEASAGRIEYRCIYVRNNHATLALENAKVWIVSNTPSAQTAVAIGVGTAAVNTAEQDVTTFSPIGTEQTAPVGVSFQAAATEGAALLLNSTTGIPAQQYKAIWIRRTVDAGAAAYNNDTFTIRVKGDTAA